MEIAIAATSHQPRPSGNPAGVGTWWDWLYEMRPPLPEEIALCQATEPLRFRLMSALLDPAQTYELPALYHGALTAGDMETACAANVGGIMAVLDAGHDFADLQPWLESAENLRERDQDISALGRGALALSCAIAQFAGAANMYQVRESLDRVSPLAEEANSDTLRAINAAIRAGCEFLSGRLLVAKAVLADTQHLIPGTGASTAAKTHLQASIALIDTIRGRYDEGRKRLDSVVQQTQFDQLPPHLWLLCLGHRMLALAYCGRPEAEIDACADWMRSRTVPEHNHYFHNYLHYTLGAAALLTGHPETALFHARTSVQLGRLCHSIEAERTPAALEVQALNDLNRHDEALALVTEHSDAWHKAGSGLLISTTSIEQASMLLKRGQVPEARAALDRARSAMPPGEDLPRNLRSDQFVTDLVNRLDPHRGRPGAAPRDPRPIQITTFGELQVEINGKVIYDRDWHGNRGKTLLKALIVLGGYKVPAERLADLLWPDADGDVARNNLKVSLWRLRRLGCSKGEPPLPWIAVQHGRVSLVSSLCRVDCIEFEHNPPAALMSDASDQAAFTSFTADFLANDDSEAWIIQHRDTLKRRFLHATCALPEAAPVQPLTIAPTLPP